MMVVVTAHVVPSTPRSGWIGEIMMKFFFIFFRVAQFPRTILMRR